MYKKFTCKNGMTVIVSPMPQMTSVSLGIWIGVGGRYESEKMSGISHLVEHMVFKGTNKMSAKILKEAVEGVGGSFNGFTSDEVTCYMVRVPYNYCSLGVDVLSDMVRDAKFDKSDLAREKFVVCEEIKMYRDQPADHVMDILANIMWPDDPLGRSLTGTMSTVKSITREDLVSFRDQNYHPGNVALIVAGKVDPAKVLESVEAKFTGAEAGKKPVFHSTKTTQSSARMKTSRIDTKQTHIAMGFHVATDDVRERFAAKLMNVILGGNMSSRLFEELREKYGLCYDISSSYKRHSDVGELHIHAGVDNSRTGRAVLAILDELRKLRDLGVVDEELSRAKEYAKGQFMLAMEGTSSRMLWLGDRFMIHGDIPEVDNVLKEIDGVTSDDITKVCGKLFRGPMVNLAVVGKLSSGEKNNLKKELERL